jgi:hypothetical protein
LYTVQPPFDNISVKPNIRSIDASKEQVVKFQNGVSVEVPADAFCDEDGNPVSGEVELSLETYDSKAAILASGIPMKYTENGTEGDFQSAGMFKLEGTVNNKKIEIRKDKKLSINYPSKTFGDFDFFYFEEDKNEVKQSGMNANAVSTPAAVNGSWKKISTPENKTTDLSKTVKTFQLQFDSKNYAELQPLEALKWNLATKFMDPTAVKNNWALNKKWTSLEISQPKWGFMDPVYEKELNHDNYIGYGSIEISPDGQTIVTSKKPITTIWSRKTKRTITIDRVKTDFSPVKFIDNYYLLIDKEEGTALYTVDGKKLAAYPDSYAHILSVKKQRIVYETNFDTTRKVVNFILADFSGKKIKEFKLKNNATDYTGDKGISVTFLVTPEDELVINSLDGIFIYDLNGNLLHTRKNTAAFVQYFALGKLLCEEVDDGLSLWDFKTNKLTTASQKDFTLKTIVTGNQYHMAHVNGVYKTPFVIIEQASVAFDKQIIWNTETNTSFHMPFYAYQSDSSLVPEIVSGYDYENKTFHVYNLKTKTELIKISNFMKLGEYGVNDFFSKDKNRILINGVSNVQLHDINGRLLKNFKNYDSLITFAGFKDRYIFTITSSGLYQLWDMNGKKIAGTDVQLEAHGCDYFFPYYDETLAGWGGIFNSASFFDNNGKLLLVPGKELWRLLDSTYVVHTSQGKQCVISPLFKLEKGMYQLSVRADNIEFHTYIYLDEQALDLINTYNTFKAQRISAEKDRLKKEIKLLRRFEIAKFGIYNWDKMIKQPNAIALEADFKFDTVSDYNNITVFMITEVNGNAVIKFYKDAWKNFSIDPTVNNKLIAILPDDRIALLTADDFKKINWEEVKKNKKYTFQMRSVKGKVGSLEMLEGYL